LPRSPPPVFLYLRPDLTISQAHQVWVRDISYVPMACGFVFLTAVLD
jgi:putative transposase